MLTKSISCVTLLIRWQYANRT